MQLDVLDEKAKVGCESLPAFPIFLEQNREV